MLGILDYGMGNLRSVLNAVRRVGGDAQLVSAPEQVDALDRLIVPGVGAFRDAIARLTETGCDEAIRRHVARARPMLGICLGLQLLFDESREDGRHRGLGLLPGRCVRFDVDRTDALKVPHMGWNTLDARGDVPLLAGIEPPVSVYFVHSYYAECADDSDIATTTRYGIDFVSSVRRDNVTATQFHPEKSQSLGLAMIANFLKWSV